MSRRTKIRCSRTAVKLSAKVKASNTCLVYTMPLYRYFQPMLPCPRGPLANSVDSATIEAANETVKDATSKPCKARGSYSHVDAETQAKIAQDTCEHGNNAAMECFSSLLGFEIKKSSMSTWKMKYLAEIS